MGNIKPTHGILDYLKTADKDLFNIGIDFSTTAIQEFKSLTCRKKFNGSFQRKS